MPSAWRLPARHHCQGRRRPRLPRAAKALGGRAHPRLALSKPPSLQGLRTSARRQRSLRQTRDDPPHDRSIDMNHTSKTDSEEARSAVSKDAGSSCSRGLVHPAKGESMTLATAEPFRAPQVASLSVRVVVDSFFAQFMPKATHSHVAIEHVSRIRGRETTTLAGECGLSLNLESKSAGAGGQYLLDFGYTPEILLRNFDLLGIAPER